MGSLEYLGYIHRRNGSSCAEKAQRHADRPPGVSAADHRLHLGAFARQSLDDVGRALATANSKLARFCLSQPLLVLVLADPRTESVQSWSHLSPGTQSWAMRCSLYFCCLWPAAGLPAADRMYSVCTAYRADRHCASPRGEGVIGSILYGPDNPHGDPGQSDPVSSQQSTTASSPGTGWSLHVALFTRMGQVSASLAGLYALTV